MNNGDFLLGDVRPVFETLYKDGEVHQTYIAGYEIDYGYELTNSDDPKLKVEGSIPFPTALLGETHLRTTYNVMKMLEEDSTIAE
ncbi:hypothetical protein C6Y43_14110 [Bacillus subtilis]|nr:hypothetical protein C6Y43_14110 [Bacillus subtilis]